MFILTVIAFVLIVAVAAEVGTRWPDQGPIVFNPMPARPRGMQETDLPPFRFRDPVRGLASAPSGSVVAPHTVGAKAA